jgi:hypothetical protein
MEKEAESREYKLVSGVFSPDDARQVLLSLIDYKISFHQRKILSHRELFGTTDTFAELRIVELERTKSDFEALVKQLLDTDTELSINCDIEINLMPSGL